jgi:error-prone DNA polymerase
LRTASAGAIVAARRDGGPFRDADDLARRAGLRADELQRLAAIGALASLGLGRREALWQAALAARPAGELFEKRGTGAHLLEMGACPLPEMTAYEETSADFAGTGMTTGSHPVSYRREALTRFGAVRAADVPALAPGTRTRVGGAVIVRQRPGTAKGTLFLTLEDESGMVQAIVRAPLLREHRATIVGHPGLVVEGVVQARDGSVSLQAERFWPLSELDDPRLSGPPATAPSHDFR